VLCISLTVQSLTGSLESKARMKHTPLKCRLRVCVKDSGCLGVVHIPDSLELFETVCTRVLGSIKSDMTKESSTSYT
jgi:hypothetical protein